MSGKVLPDGTFPDCVDVRLARIERALSEMSHALARFEIFEREPFMTTDLARRLREALIEWEPE
jgi:hypothetical protein